MNDMSVRFKRALRSGLETGELDKVLHAPRGRQAAGTYPPVTRSERRRARRDLARLRSVENVEKISIIPLLASFESVEVLKDVLALALLGTGMEEVDDHV